MAGSSPEERCLWPHRWLQGTIATAGAGYCGCSRNHARTHGGWNGPVAASPLSMSAIPETVSDQTSGARLSERAVPLTALHTHRGPWEHNNCTLYSGAARDAGGDAVRRCLICGPAAIGNRQSISPRRDELELVQSAILGGYDACEHEGHQQDRLAVHCNPIQYSTNSLHAASSQQLAEGVRPGARPRPVREHRMRPSGSVQH